MPSPHRRVGLVIDDEMSSALTALREQYGAALPEAALARKALFDGVAFGAVLREASSRSPSRDAAQQLLRSMRQLIERVEVPPLVRTKVIDEIERASRDFDLADRRRRQLSLLRSPNPHGRAALAEAEWIDAFDPPAS